MKFYRFNRDILLGVITLILFIIPFLWLKPGFVDLGGDGSRWYFVDPYFSAQYLLSQENLLGQQNQSMMIYLLVLSVIKTVIQSPTLLISTVNGIMLSLGFFFTALCIRELIQGKENKLKHVSSFMGILGGMAYISFISNQGWFQALHTQNQVFINPLMFYLLLRLLRTASMKYGYWILLVSFLNSQNFGFSAMPQIMSFYPLTIIFLYLYNRLIENRVIPWKKLIFIIVFFCGLQAYHLLPTIGVLSGHGSLRDYVFNSGESESSGVKFFNANYPELGKISKQLFAPTEWGGRNITIIIIPFIAMIGFIKGRSKLLLLTGIFFAVTLFLTSANILNIGIELYRFMFLLPGFVMFRAFYDKWYFVYSFFFALMFSFSFYELVKKLRIATVALLSLVVAGTFIYRILPFLHGDALYKPLFQTENIAPVMKIDPDLIDTLQFVKHLPNDGKFLTVPLTFPYFQVAYGSEGGAYSGTSLVTTAAGKKDYAGFWSFGKYDQEVYGELFYRNFQGFRDSLDVLEVKYIFRNTDTRIMEDFPGYPYVYPGMIYSDKDSLPIIKTQSGYDELLSYLPLNIIYQKGYYIVYEITDAPDYQQYSIDSKLHLYFFIGRLVTVLTLLYVIFLIIRTRVHYEKSIPKNI